MTETRVASLFMNGRNQAVRLPAEFRFDAEQVYLTRDERTGDVLISTRPGAFTWSEWFQLMDTIDVPEDFMAERPMNILPNESHVFSEEH